MHPSGGRGIRTNSLEIWSAKKSRSLPWKAAASLRSVLLRDPSSAGRAKPCKTSMGDARTGGEIFVPNATKFRPASCNGTCAASCPATCDYGCHGTCHCGTLNTCYYPGPCY